MNKQVALALIAHILAKKSTHKSVNAFINSCKASKNDISILYNRVLNGKDAVAKAYQDANGFWHIATV